MNLTAFAVNVVVVLVVVAVVLLRGRWGIWANRLPWRRAEEGLPPVMRPAPGAVELASLCREWVRNRGDESTADAEPAGMTVVAGSVGDDERTTDAVEEAA